MIMTSRGSRSGFSLIEILIVVAVLVALASIAFVSSNAIMESSRVNIARKTISLMYNACEAYRFVNGQYPEVEPLNRLSFDSTADPIAMPSSPHVLNAIYVTHPVKSSDLDESGHYLDPWGNPYIYEKSYATDGDSATEGSGVWWAERGLSSEIKIYSVGATDNLDSAAVTGPYWLSFQPGVAAPPTVVFKKIGE